MTDNGTFFPSSLEGYSWDLVKVKDTGFDGCPRSEENWARDAILKMGKKSVFGITATDGSSGRRDSHENRARMQDQALVSSEPVFCAAQ